MGSIQEFDETQLSTNFDGLSQLIIIVDGLTTLYLVKDDNSTIILSLNL
jgi:hypothetical protein